MEAGRELAIPNRSRKIALPSLNNAEVVERLEVCGIRPKRFAEGCSRFLQASRIQ